MIFIFAIETLVRQGEAILDIYYVREKFDFESTDAVSDWWIWFHLIYTLWGMFALVVMVPILKNVYNLADPCIIFFSAFGSLFRSFIFIICKNKVCIQIFKFFILS